MSYEQQNWVTGNRITAEKLNHMEEGIASGGTEPLIVSEDGSTLNAHWKEIDDALQAGIPAYVSASSDGIGSSTRRMAPIVVTNKSTDIVSGDVSYVVHALDANGGNVRVLSYYTTAEDGFPTSGGN